MTGRTTSESDWANLFDAPPSVPQPITSVDSTAVVASSSALPAAAGAGTSTGIGSSSSANRRVGKSARRRTRTSRKAPTTLFNTDINNFRAMVQQFTGFPSLERQGLLPPMTFHNQFSQQQHHHPPLLSQPEISGTAPFQLPVQQQVFLDQPHLFGLGNSNSEINPFMSGFSRGGGSSSGNNNNNNDGNNNNDDESKLRSNMEYFSFDQFDRTNDRF